MGDCFSDSTHPFTKEIIASELTLSDEGFRKAVRVVIKNNHGNAAMNLVPEN
ncbi:hypothetical protein SL267_46520 [Serratia marcescens]|nr:hypothetical protein SL267_46520 [Serratia marcescens]